MLVALVIGPARAQVPAPAFVDDSTIAAETIAQLDDLARAGSLQEAARAVQRLLDQEGDRLLPAPASPSVFVPVRRAAHDALLDRPELLEAYIQQQAPEAQRLLDAGRHDLAYRTRFLTPAGFEAALRVAQDHLENARFHAGWRTLQRLERHPLAGDPERAAEAVRVARAIAAYVPGDDAAALRRWENLAGDPPAPVDRIDAPPGLADRDLPALAPARGGRPTLAGIVPTPLHAVTLPAAASWENQNPRSIGQRATWALPSVLGSAVYVNDGTAVTAHDRFTLRRLWRAPAPPPGADDIDSQSAQRLRNRTRQIEDPTTVTLDDGAVFAALGTVVSGRREGDERIVRIDAETGGIDWAVYPASLNASLNDASVRGPLVVAGDTLLFTLRKNQRSRRTVALYVAGVDTGTGALKWSRLVGSVGALPYQQATRAPQALAVHRGVAVLSDEIGLTAAIETATGVPLWVRRDDPIAPRADRVKPWAVHAPIASGGAIVTLSPNQASIRRLDLETGRILGQRDASRLGSPAYLVELPGAPGSTRGRIAAVGDTTIAIVDPETLEPLVGTVDLAGPFGDITGRVLAAGDAIIAPVPSGIALVRTDEGASEIPIPIAADATGNVAVADGQLLIADDTQLRSYLIWDVAAGMLRERIEASPGDPGPAVTYAELAFRAGRTDEVLPAIDLAIASLTRAGQTDREAGARLFEVTLASVHAAHDAWGDDGDAAGVSGEPELTDELLTRLGRLADTPEQRVAHLLAVGRQREAEGDTSRAADTYQQILTEPALASAAWRGPRVSIRAELEAERRLRGLIRRGGRSIYEPFERLAGDERRALGPGATAEQLAGLARRYPLASAAVEARLDEARLHREAERTRQAVYAAGQAVSIVQTLRRSGVGVPGDLAGRAFGASILALAAANRPEDAAALAAEAAESFPGVPLLDGITPLATDVLFDDLARRLAERRTLPRLGPALALEDEPQLIQGYVLRPLARAEPGGVARARFDGALIVSAPKGTLSWFAPDGSGGDARLEAVWSREIDRDPILLRLDQASAWMFWPDETGGWLERIDLTDGSPLWTSAPWTELSEGVLPPDEDDRNPARTRFVDPIEGRVRSDQLLVTLDARTIILVERGGRAAAIDTATGRPLWAASLDVSRVHDADTASGILAVAGTGPDREGRLGPVLVTLDPRTGEPIYTDQAVPGEIRWVRIRADGTLLTGLRSRILSVSPTDAHANWTLANPEISETDDAWVMGDALIVRSGDDDLWHIDAETGRAGTLPLETRGRINTSDRVVAERLPSPAGDRLLFSGSDGVCLFSPDGELVGVDAFTQPAQVMPAAVAEGTLAVLKIERGRFGLGGTRFVMNLMDTESARVTESAAIRLFGEPSAVEAIDGRVLISAGEATLVLRVPVE